MLIELGYFEVLQPDPEGFRPICRLSYIHNLDRATLVSHLKELNNFQNKKKNTHFHHMILDTMVTMSPILEANHVAPS